MALNGKISLNYNKNTNSIDVIIPEDLPVQVGQLG